MAGAQPKPSVQPSERGKALASVCLCWDRLWSLTRWAALTPRVILQPHGTACPCRLAVICGQLSPSSTLAAPPAALPQL